MKRVIAVLVAAMFATAIMPAFAAEENMKEPTVAEQTNAVLTNMVKAKEEATELTTKEEKAETKAEEATEQAVKSAQEAATGAVEPNKEVK